ncbi:hypothetical protein [Pseudomonas sp. BIGb0164]|uniref:hypothetical protein n=1 Tax=Pseudomonas sp. BIGb0164 TaxID=2940605 RepID=UPI00216929FD|nr:hypothetical protein [Pseudomonas sp. BIGb0164]MCS4251443.1 hypothetical protein [Pseudomonas sp. BIGb0164]
MLKQNQRIALTGAEALDALKEIEFILISLRKMGSYYAEKPNSTDEYRKATTDFIDDCAITHRLAKVRSIISRKFDDTLGEDDMDDIERHVSYLTFWKPDQPLNKRVRITDPFKIPKGTIEQICCKKNELWVVFSDLNGDFLVITFHNPTAFQAYGALGTETLGVSEENIESSQNSKHFTNIQSKKNYCFKSSDNSETVLAIIADGYSTERI